MNVFLMAIVIFLTSGSSWAVPADWNNGANTIEVIGAGGGGSLDTTGAGNGGGGGGAYSQISNISLGGTIPFSIGTAGLGATVQGPGQDGGDTYFNGSSLASCSVGAQGGKGGTRNGVNSFGAGGNKASGVGDVKNSGGDGGYNQGSGAAAGGGGSAGPTADGAHGSQTSSVTRPGGGGGGANGGSIGNPYPGGSSAGSGGNGPLGTGSGAGGTLASPNGIDGTVGTGGGGGGSWGDFPSADVGNAGNGASGSEWDSTHGSGGGGGGTGVSNHATTQGGDGGLYGAGGGSTAGTSVGLRAGNGAQGLIVITYTPISTAVVGGHGSEEGDAYSEPRRVIIAGKPFTVRSKGEYFALLKRFGKKGSVDAAQKQASQVIQEARETARESLSKQQIEETAALLRLAMEKKSLEARRKEQELTRSIEDSAIPIQILMLMAAEL